MAETMAELIPDKKFEDGRTVKMDSAGFYRCEKNARQFIIVPQSKYKDGEGINLLEKTLFKIIESMTKD